MGTKNILVMTLPKGIWYWLHNREQKLRTLGDSSTITRPNRSFIGFGFFGNEWNRNPDLKECSCWLGSSHRSRFYSPGLVHQLYLQTCCEFFGPRTCLRSWIPRNCASSFSVSLCNEYHQVSQRLKIWELVGVWWISWKLIRWCRKRFHQGQESLQQGSKATF